MSYAPAYPHDPVEEIGSNVFMVRGSIKMNPIVRITRNMAIIREAGELTLINPLRLSTEGEKQLKALGTVRHVLRLGCFHGIDDPYYVDTFKAAFWSQAGGTTYAEPPIDHELSATCELPFADASLFCFQGTKQPESALLLSRDDGLLLTCDALQHYGDYSNNNFAARIMMPFIGFPKRMLIGPLWLKFMTQEDGSLKSEFERLLELRFESLLSAHGTFLADGAHAAVKMAFDLAYAN